MKQIEIKSAKSSNDSIHENTMKSPKSSDRSEVKASLINLFLNKQSKKDTLSTKNTLSDINQKMKDTYRKEGNSLLTCLSSSRKTSIIDNDKNKEGDDRTQITFNIHKKTLKSSVTELPSNKGTSPISAASEKIDTKQLVDNFFLQEDCNHVIKIIKDHFEATKEIPPTTLEFYKIGKLLGRGAFGKVHLGVHKLTGKLVAIKSIKKEFLSNSHSKTKVMQEFSILKLLRHNSVIRLYETFESYKHILFVIELCAGGDLLNYVRRRKRLKENYTKYIFKQLLEGLEYCHQKGILHRDIKLDNILLNSKGDIKICDFGVSKIIKPSEKIIEQCGTPAYIAPEVLIREGYYGFASDVWSAGIVLFAMLYGTVPFKANNMQDLHTLIKKGKYTLKEDVSEDARHLLSIILEVDPNKRASISDIMKHSWLKHSDICLAMFNDYEKQSIFSEFSFSKKDNDNESDGHFTEQNIDSSYNDLTRNASTRSNILAPFNTTNNGNHIIMDHMVVYNKKEIIKFKGKVKDVDRQYEKNNNGELDNGVYNKFVRKTNSKNSDNSLGGDSFEKGNPQSKENSLLNSVMDDSKKNSAPSSPINCTVKTAAETECYDQSKISLLEEYGFPREYIIRSLHSRELNYCTTTYYLL